MSKIVNTPLYINIDFGLSALGSKDYFWIYTVVFLISEFWRQIRPKSTTEYDPETSDAENETERLQLRYRRLKYKIKAGLKNSRKQEKIINQLKLKNEMLINEKQKDLQASDERYNRLEMEKQRLENENQNYKTDLQEKQKAFEAFEERFNRLEIENQEYKDGWEVDQGIIQSHEREIQKSKTNLQENQKELEERFNKLQTEKQRLEDEKQKCEIDLKDTETKLQLCERENQKYKKDLQEKVKAIEEQYNTFMQRELLSD